MKSKKPDFSPEYLREILSYSKEIGDFKWQISNGSAKIGQIAGYVHRTKYRYIKIKKRKYYAHNLAWYYVTGEWPKNEIDHRNTIEDDNRWDNLREATRSQNSANRKCSCRNTSGYKGVTWKKKDKKWEVRITKDRHWMYLGQFTVLEDAVEAYKKKALELFGEFARF